MRRTLGTRLPIPVTARRALTVVPAVRQNLPCQPPQRGALLPICSFWRKSLTRPGAASHRSCQRVGELPRKVLLRPEGHARSAHNSSKSRRGESSQVSLRMQCWRRGRSRCLLALWQEPGIAQVLVERAFGVIRPLQNRLLVETGSSPAFVNPICTYAVSPTYAVGLSIGAEAPKKPIDCGPVVRSWASIPATHHSCRKSYKPDRDQVVDSSSDVVVPSAIGRFVKRPRAWRGERSFRSALVAAVRGNDDVQLRRLPCAKVLILRLM
jgi:hypothetical protein